MRGIKNKSMVHRREPSIDQGARIGPGAASGIGAVCALAGFGFAQLPLRSMGFLDWSSPILPTVSVAVLAALAAASVTLPPMRSLGSGNLRARMRKWFPAVAPASVDWLDVPAAASPQEWIASGSMKNPEAAYDAFYRQVSAPVDERLLRSLLAVLKTFEESDGDGRKAIDELSRRMWATPGDIRVLDGFIAWMGILRPGLDRRLPPMDGVRGSPYGVIHVVAALERARTSGSIVASSEFLWVKLVDRRLWYAINNVGRLRFHVEGAGPMAHWMAQKKLGTTLARVEVEGALAGVRDFFEDLGKPEPYLSESVH